MPAVRPGTVVQYAGYHIYILMTWEKYLSYSVKRKNFKKTGGCICPNISQGIFQNSSPRKED